MTTRRAEQITYLICMLILDGMFLYSYHHFSGLEYQNIHTQIAARSDIAGCVITTILLSYMMFRKER